MEDITPQKNKEKPEKEFVFISLRITQCQPFCLSSQMADATIYLKIKEKNLLLDTFVWLFQKPLVTEEEKKKTEKNSFRFFSFFILWETTSRINILTRNLKVDFIKQQESGLAIKKWKTKNKNPSSNSRENIIKIH